MGAMTDTTWLPVIDDPTINPRGCGGMAFAVRRRQYRSGESLQPEDIQWPNGALSTYGEDLVCGACALALTPSTFVALATRALHGAGLLEQ
jgi:hypothetical protein